MKKQLLIVLACLMLLGGWLGAFILTSIPQGTRLYILGPTLLIGIGMGLMFKLSGGKAAAITVALTALAALASMNQIYPSAGVSISAFQSREAEQLPGGHWTTIKVRDTDRRGAFETERQLEVFDDIEISLFAKMPGATRMMAFDDKGHLYVSLPDLGAIYLLTDSDKDGFADVPVLFHVGMDRPHGLAWHDGRLYVAETSRIVALTDRDGDFEADDIVTIADGFPDDGGHWTRSLSIGADGFLYVSIGSRCNACEESDERRAAVLKVDPQTGTTSLFASGLRNTVGLAFAPGGKALWGSDNGRDMLGDDLPPDEINLIQEGRDYGWPYCYGQQVADPELGSRDMCEETEPSIVNLQAHSAPLGIAFGNGLAAPENDRQSLYVAYHGSWNRTVPTGYKLVRIPFAEGEPTGDPADFIRGWLAGDVAWGRPVAPLAGPDGALYLSDDRADAVYRIEWKQVE